MWFGVADVREGAAVRCALDAAGFVRVEILVLCGLLPEDVAGLVENRLTPVAWTVEQVRALSGQRGLKVHVELETGMGRQGCRPGAEFGAVLDAIDTAGLSLGGVMTHFCAAEIVGSEKTREQMTQFERAVEQVRVRGLRPEWVHAGASSSLDDPRWRGEWLSGLAASVGAKPMVRCGIALYGYCNPLEGGEPVVRPNLRPVMTWKTRVLDVREMAAGDCIGYNSTFTAQRPMRLALLPVGYADGIRRALSSTNARDGGWVMVRGVRAPIVGRVSMNLTMVDVTGVDGVAVGDDVVLLGDGVTADDHARLAGTISYEILCGVHES
jgi:alanine racemase